MSQPLALTIALLAAGCSGSDRAMPESESAMSHQWISADRPAGSIAAYPIRLGERYGSASSIAERIRASDIAREEIAANKAVGPGVRLDLPTRIGITYRGVRQDEYYHEMFAELSAPEPGWTIESLLFAMTEAVAPHMKGADHIFPEDFLRYDEAYPIDTEGASVGESVLRNLFFQMSDEAHAAHEKGIPVFAIHCGS